MGFKNTICLPLLGLVLTGVVGCSSNKSDSASDPSTWVSNNPRVSISNRPLELNNSASSIDGVSAQALSVSLGLIATVAPPTINGIALQANDVTMSGLNALVSYNVAGATQAGAVDGINLLNILLPLISSEASFPNMDVNHIYLSGTTAYAVGATSDNAAPGPAVVRAVSAGALSGTITTGAQNFTLPSYAGTGLVAGGASLYAVSGDGGGLTTLDKSTMVQTAYNAITDARDVAVMSSTGKVYVVAGQPGRIIEHTAAGAQTNSWNLGGASIAESKSTIIAGATLLLATIGDGGVKVVCAANGQTLATIANPTGTGLPAAKVVANSAAAAPGLVFVANGEAGVYVYSLKYGSTVAGTNCKTQTASLLGSINFGTAISANHVFYSGGVLFVASGTGGFKLVNVVSIGLFNDTVDFN